MKNKKKKASPKKRIRCKAHQPQAAGSKVAELVHAGVKAYHAGELHKAREILENVIEKNSAHVDALSYLGLIAHEQEQYSRALFLLQQAAYHDPKSPVHHNNLANVHASLGQLHKAAECYFQALEYAPDHADLLFNLANVQKELGQLNLARDNYTRTLHISPDHTRGQLALASLLIGNGEIDHARELVDLVLEKHPAHNEGQYLHAQLLLEDGNLEQALHILSGLELDPESPHQFTTRLLSLIHNEDEDALTDFIRSYPDPCAEALGSVFASLSERKQQTMAAKAFVSALESRTDVVEAQSTVIKKLLSHTLYEQAYNLGVSLEDIYPESETLMNNIGVALNKFGRLTEAIEYFSRAAEIDPYYGNALTNMATTLYQKCEHEQAHYWYTRLLENDPENTLGHSNLLMSLHYNPEFSKKDIFAEHVKWDHMHAAHLFPVDELPSIEPATSQLRVGMVSGSFKRHPVGYMIMGALLNWDFASARLFMYSDTKGPDNITAQIRGLDLTWRDTVGLSDTAFANLIQADAIDILIDLSGHADGSRLPALARKPAPIQAKWVGGQFNTSGMQAIDYFITDWMESPAGEENWFTETLVRMPNGYVTFSPPDYAPNVGLLPALRNRHLTFGCFNNLAKVNAHVVRVWSEILNRVPNSRLVLKSKQLNDPVIQDEFRSRFGEHGISAQRLDLRPESPHNELLAQYNEIDIALDPFPYSGGLTTCEALWMGVPVLTKPGETFAGRHAASHVTNVGLKDWVVDSEEEYISTAVSWAKNLGALTRLRSGLREQVRNSPLCDHERFAQNFMDALWWMYEDTLRKQNETQAERLLEEAN